MSRSTMIACYVLLFPVLGAAYFGLMILGQADFGPLHIGQFEFHEIEQLRLGGGPSLANLIEVPLTALGGLLGAAVLWLCRLRGCLKTDRSVFLYISVIYAAAIVFYFMMPTLPE